MYANVKDWVNIPITIKPFIKRSATGGKIYGPDIDALCYPKGEVNIVRNWQGVEVVSHSSLYMDGNVQVTKLDDIVFEGEQLPVQAVTNFYRDGHIDLRVVYV